MQKIFLCLSLVIASFSLNAQNVVHDANAQVRNVGSFSKIRVSSAISLYLSQGNTQAVAVSSEDADATEKIKTEVSNGTLKIYVDNGLWNKWNWGNKHLRAYVTFTQLEMLDASGASSVEITDPINVNDFKLVLSGASSIKGDIKGSDLDFDVNGASTGKLGVKATSFKLSASGASTFKGNVSADKMDYDVNGASTTDVDGSTTDLTVSASGASNFRGADMQAVSCKIEATGASSANINVSKTIDATASGASSIHYSGDATISKIDVSGSSTVKKRS
jgi:Putative auto-transporter adhesin, head GIN domain